MTVALDIGFVVVAVLLVALLAVKTVMIIPQARAGIVERFGRYRRTLEPGLNLIVPFVDRLRPLVDLRERVVSFPPQSVITRDNLVVSIDTVIYFQVIDPKAATYEIADYIIGVAQLTATTLRSVIGGMDLKETLTSRDQINARLCGELDDASGKWGIRVARAEIRAIEPQQSVAGLMKEGSVSRLTDEQARAIATSGLSKESLSARQPLAGDGSTRADDAALKKAWRESPVYANSRKQSSRLLIALLSVLVITACLTFVLMVYIRASWRAWAPIIFTGLALAVCIAAFLLIVAKSTRTKFDDFRDNYQAGAASKSLSDQEQLPVRWLADPDLQNLINLNIKTINHYQDLAIKNAKDAVRNSQFAMSLGFLILVAGAVLTIFTPNSTAKVVVAVLASLGSLLSGYIGKTFLKAQDQAMHQLNYYSRQPLVTSHMLAAERLTPKLGGNTQQNALREVLKNYLVVAGREEQLDSSLPLKSRRGVWRRPPAESSTVNGMSPDQDS